MDWSKFLTPEAIATYLVFLLGVVVAGIGFIISRFINRDRPKKVVVAKVKETSLVEIDEEVRDDIQVTYKGRLTSSLYLSTFSISNKGKEVIDDIKVSIQLPNANVVEAIIEDSISGRQCQVSNEENGNCLTVSIPYLNPENIYKDKLTIKTFAFRSIHVASIQGGGRGWTVDYVDRVEIQSELADIISNMQIDVGGLPMVNVRAVSDFIFKVLPRVVNIVIGK